MKNTIYLLLIASLIIGCKPKANEEMPSEPPLSKALNNVLHSYDLQGIAVSILDENGTEVWSGTHGNSHQGQPITQDMKFGIGSITKSFVATIILQLVEEGLLSLDNTIGDFITESYSHIDPAISIENLLRHRSGIFNYTNNDFFIEVLLSEDERVWTPEEILNYVEAPLFSPDSNWSYSNTNYILLGLIIEKVTAQSLAENLKLRIFDRLDMVNSYLPAKDSISGLIAHPWSYLNRNTLRDLYDIDFSMNALYSAAWAAGAMTSTAHDLTIFSHSIFNSDILLTQESKNQMLNFGMVDNGGFTHFVGYGLGIQSFQSNGIDFYGHNGDILGYGSLVVYLPVHGFSIAILVNQDLSEAIRIKLINDIIQELI